jgi:hypothetical protein
VTIPKVRELIDRSQEMQKYRILGVLALLLVAGCVSASKTVLIPNLQPVAPADVRFYFQLDSVPAHDRVAILEVNSNDMMNTTTAVLDKLRIEAAKLGADGVILVGSESEDPRTRAMRAALSGADLGGRVKTMAVAIRRH